VYYILTENPDPYPPDLLPYLGLSSLMAKIGAASNWSETNEDVYSNFAQTGDWMNNFRPHLEKVINTTGIRTLVFDGVLDYLCNHDGVEDMVSNLQTQYSAEYDKEAYSNWTVAGHSAGQFKNAGLFSYVRVYGAGHEVAAYEYTGLERGQAALEMFSQIMANNSISNT
jgi:carboxypeptidase C (cathepsin A)